MSTKIHQTTTNENFNPINATSGNVERSEKYKHASSLDLIKTFEKFGFQLDGVSHGKPRKTENKGFQKHIMLFSKPDLIIDGENKIQIVCLNSHDGSSALKLNLGIYRAICANGLVVGDSFLEHVVRHIGDSFLEKLEYSINDIILHAPKIAKQVNEFKSIQLNANQVFEFNDAVAMEKLKHVDNLLTFKNVGTVKRAGDVSNDLYTVLNRAQESLIRGGIKYQYSSQDEKGNFKVKNGTTRAVKDVKKQIELNKFVWNEAEKLAA